MKKFKFIILLVISFLIFIPKLNALTIGGAETVIDRSNHYYYSDTTISELWSTSEGERVFCLDHGLQICKGYMYYYDTVKYEGPACAFTDYGWYSWGDEKNKSGTSGTSRYHNIIRFIQRYSDSSFSCERYLYSSGSCTSNNKTAKDDSSASINLSKVTDKFTLENDYYIEEIKVALSGSLKKYTLTSSDNSFIVTTSKTSTDNVLNKEINNSTLYVKIPKEKVNEDVNISLSAKGNYSTTCNYLVPGLYRYRPLSQYRSYNCQRISFVAWKNGSNTQTFSKSASLSLSASPVTGKIKIIKYDSQTNLPLANVKFKLYKSSGELATYIDGTQVPELVTDTNGEIVVDNLYRDTYILEETSNLPEYLKLNQDLTITLDSNYIEIPITNDPIIIQISKQDITTKTELEGANMVVKDENGNIIKEFVSTKEPTSFYISPGVYSLIETSVPKGYEKLESSFRFKVNEDGTAELIDTNNKYFGITDGIIILYNEIEKVEVPDTFSPLNYLLVGGGIIILLGGAFLIYKGFKEEK